MGSVTGKDCVPREVPPCGYSNRDIEMHVKLYAIAGSAATLAAAAALVIAPLSASAAPLVASTSPESALTFDSNWSCNTFGGGNASALTNCLGSDGSSALCSTFETLTNCSGNTESDRPYTTPDGVTVAGGNVYVPAGKCVTLAYTTGLKKAGDCGGSPAAAQTSPSQAAVQQYNTKNGLQTIASMTDQLHKIGYSGPTDTNTVIAAFAQATGGSVTPSGTSTSLPQP
ncbi:MAG: hypothetical protein JOY61_03420 [Chloroflexi bacterium]|nr:hypothetical protein [Chloroflexota bacterium]